MGRVLRNLNRNFCNFGFVGDDDSMTFNDVLEIKNGKNQKAVENPKGTYPIYGSGGVMGYADEYICKADTIVIGRKGSINNPIYVDEPFWNVDTAFGLEAKEDVLKPHYLYYFCKKFDFERLNKAVTIPSLTKSDLLKIEINLPDLDEQQGIIDKLMKIEKIIQYRKDELSSLDELIKARFVEMFGDPVLNDKKFSTLSGEDFFKLSNGKAVPEEKRHEVGIPAYGGNGISWYTNEVLRVEDTLVVGRVGFQSGNVHYAVGPLWITDNAMYISQYDKGKINLVFLCELMQRVNFSRFQDAGDLKKITQKPFMSFQYILPSMELQQKFVDFKEQVDKSKSAIEKELKKTQLLFDSLMQKYFG